MADTTTKDQSWDDRLAFEAWRHHAGAGGDDKDRMVKISSLLLGVSTGIVSLMLNTAVKSDVLCEPRTAICLSFFGLIISCISAMITLLYGGYANRNWAKADQIAEDRKWLRLYPTDSPIPELREKGPLIRFAIHGSEPRTRTELAPIFWLFFWMSLLSAFAQLILIIWGVGVLNSGESNVCANNSGVGRG
jgi:hypothetical protein